MYAYTEKSLVQCMRMRRSLIAFFSGTFAGKNTLTYLVFSFHQEFKVFFLCFAVLVAATSAATVCKCEDKKVPNMRDQLYSSTFPSCIVGVVVI